MLSAMAPHGREMSQDLRKKIISLHKKGEGYKKISKAFLISQNTVAKVVQTFKKDGTATISQRRPGRPRKLTPRQERLLMRRVEENRHASSLQLSEEVESQTGETISCDTIRAVVLESGLETFFYRLGLVLDSLVFGLGLVSDLVIGLAKCSSWSRPSPAIYAFFSLSKQNH